MPDTDPQHRTQPRKWKRTAVIVLLLLAGGAIVNVAVAWGCALTVQPLAVHGEPEAIDSFLVTEWITDSRGPLYNVYVGNSPGLSFRRVWSTMVDETSEFDVTTQVFDSDTFIQLGWPLSCTIAVVSQRGSLINVIRYSRRPTVAPSPLPDATTIASTGLLVRQPDFIGGEMRVLPLHPILPSFIINTLFYALLLWLLFTVPFAARRMIRRRRGLCEKCAYPIGVSPVCTECGAAVRPGPSRGQALQ